MIAGGGFLRPLVVLMGAGSLSVALIVGGAALLMSESPGDDTSSTDRSDQSRSRLPTLLGPFLRECGVGECGHGCLSAASVVKTAVSAEFATALPVKWHGNREITDA